MAVQGAGDLGVPNKSLFDSAVAAPLAAMEEVVVTVLGCPQCNKTDLAGLISGTVYLPPGVDRPWGLLLLALFEV